MGSQFDLFDTKNAIESGRLAGLKGAEKAETRANEQPGFDFTVEAIKAVMNFPQPVFSIPQVRLWAEKTHGFPTPKQGGFDGRAWGAIPARLLKAKIIEQVGMTRSPAKNCHAGHCARWRKTGKQVKFDMDGGLI